VLKVVAILWYFIFLGLKYFSMLSCWLMAFPYYVGDNLFGCNPETEGMLMIFILSICVCKLLNYNFIGLILLK
jgi:hypothetical protein